MEFLAFWNKWSVDKQMSTTLQAVLQGGIYPESVLIFLLWYARQGHGRMPAKVIREMLQEACARQRLQWSVGRLNKSIAQSTCQDLDIDMAVVAQLAREYEASVILSRTFQYQQKAKKDQYLLQDACHNLHYYCRWLQLPLDATNQAHVSMILSLVFDQLPRAATELTWSKSCKRFLRSYPQCHTIPLEVTHGTQ